MAETIGGVVVEITGDYSGLQSDFDAAVAIAVSKGATLGEAINAALKLPDTTPLTDALAVIGAQSDAAASHLEGMASAMESAASAAGTFSSAAEDILQSQREADAELTTAQNVLAEIQSAYDQGAAGANDLARAADAVDTAFTAANPAIKESGDDAHSASEGFGDMATELLKLGGITVSIDALLQLGKAAIEAADQIDDAKTALTTLTGSAEQANTTIAALRDVAQDEGLSFPTLVTAAQRMTAMLPLGSDVADILAHIGNAAELMHTSIEAAATKFDTLVESGNASARSLGSLGIRMDDLDAAMERAGVSADLLGEGTKKAFAALDNEDRVNILTDAMSRLDGVAKQMNDDIGGDTVRLMNQWRETLVQIGDAITPIAAGAMPAFSAALKAIVSGAALAVTGLNILIDTVVGFGSTAIATFNGLADVAAKALTGDYKGAISAAKDAMDAISANATHMKDSIIADTKAGADFITKIYATDVPNATKAASAGAKDLTTDFSNLGTAGAKAAEQIVPLAKATHDLVDNTASALNPAANLTAAEAALGDAIEKTQTSLLHANANLQTAVDRLKDTKEAASNGAASMGDIEIAEGRVAKAAQDLANAQKAANAALAAVDAGNTKTALAAINEALSNAGAEAILAGDDLKDLGIDLDNLGAKAPAMSALNKAFIDLGINAKAAKPDVDTLIADLQTLANSDTVDWSQITAGLANFDKEMQQVAKTDLPAATAAIGQSVDILITAGAPLDVITTQMGVFQGYIQKLAKTDLPDAIAEQGKYIAQLGEIGAPISEIVKATEAWDKMQIQLAEDSGKSASKYIINLTMMQQSTKDAADSIKNVLGNAFVDLDKAWNDAFDKLGKALADNIVAGKSWADTWHTFVKQIETEILESLIGTAFKALRSEMDSLLSSLFPSLNAAITGTGGAIGGLAGAAKTAAGSVTSVGEAATDAFPSISKAGGAAGGLASGAGAAASSLTGMVTAISSVIGALAGIAGDILQAHANNLLGEIEINTRSAFNEITNLRQDAWGQYDGLFGRLGDIWGTLQALGAAGTGASEGMKNELDALSNIGQTLLDIDTNIYNVLTTLQNGIGTSGKSTGTQDLSGQSLAALNAAVTALNGIWSDENLVVQGIQNLAIDIQALAGATNQGASDFKNLFTNAQTTTAGQIATIGKQISDNNAQIALALASNNTTLASSLTAQNATLQQQLNALQDIQKYGSAEAAAAAESRDAAIKQVAIAQTVAEKIAALQAEAKADAELALAEQKIGNQSAADAALKAGADIAAQIAALMGPLSDIDANTAGLADAIGRGSGAPSQETSAPAGTVSSGSRGGATGTGTVASGPPVISRPSKSFDMGGFNPVDQVVNLHANEWVIPPSPATIALPMDVLSRIRVPDMPQVPDAPNISSFTGGAGGANSHSSSDTYNIVINTPSTNPSDLVRQVAQEIKTRTGRTAKFSN